MEPRENILRLHYADMKRDLASHVDKVARHIGVNNPPDIMERIVDAAKFGNMKANADRFAPVGGSIGATMRVSLTAQPATNGKKF